VLALHGDRDEYGSIAFPNYIVENTAGESAMRILEDCGHVPHRERMDDVINHIKLFL
jgi:pimeloyl-ACP methyl ester carboxylesterase